MKYMLLIYLDEQALSEAEREACYAESTRLAEQIHADGRYLSDNPLPPEAMATSERIRDGIRFVSYGPFAETRDQLGGDFLFVAQDLDEAIAVAAHTHGPQGI